MPDSLDTIIERIEGLKNLIDEKFSSTHDKLESIETQTKKTNGRVTDLEWDRAKFKGALAVIFFLITLLGGAFLKKFL